MVQAIAETDIAQGLGRFLFADLRIDARVDQRQFDVSQTRGTRQKIERLENETDLVIADCRQLVVVHRRDILAIEEITAGAWGIQTTEHIHQGGFPAATWSHDGEIFVPPDLERHAAQRVDCLFAHHVNFRDVLDIDDNRLHLN